MDRLIIPNKIFGGYNEITKVELLQTPYIVEQEFRGTYLKPKVRFTTGKLFTTVCEFDHSLVITLLP